jgi:hypothetical protein
MKRWGGETGSPFVIGGLAFRSCTHGTVQCTAIWCKVVQRGRLMVGELVIKRQDSLAFF